MMAMQVIDLAGLPVGAELSFTSTRGNVFKVRLIGGDSPNYGNGRMVRVLEAPIEYCGATVLCVVPSSAQIGLMAHVYHRSQTTVMPGDVVYIIDEIGAAGVPRRRVRPFCVQTVTVARS